MNDKLLKTLGVFRFFTTRHRTFSEEKFKKQARTQSVVQVLL
jgi:hypothetical protein